MDMELASIEAYFIKKKKKELTTSNAKEESGEKNGTVKSIVGHLSCR